MATNASSSSSATGPSMSFNISAFVSAKLSKSNYLLWESQLKPFLIGQNWWRFVDGSCPSPPQTLPPAVTDKAPEGAPAASVPNPNYVSWYQTDQYLMSLFRATLTVPFFSRSSASLPPRKFGIVFVKLSPNNHLWMRHTFVFHFSLSPKDPKLSLSISLLPKIWLINSMLSTLRWLRWTWWPMCFVV